MTLPNEPPLKKVQFYVTAGYSCGYLPKKMAQSLIATPAHLIRTETYNGLIQQGFRRSGLHVYQPHCENCQACISTRIPVRKFIPSRSQKRAKRKHKSLKVTILPVEFHQEHYDLYQAYQSERHSEHISDSDSVKNEDKFQYEEFICSSLVDSVLVEFRDDTQLKMVSIIDLVDGGISAVYTFYDTTDPKASYGTYNVIWQAEWAQQLGLGYVYLGYWIEGNAKMAYKNKFKPLEKLIDNQWVLSD